MHRHHRHHRDHRSHDGLIRFRGKISGNFFGHRLNEPHEDLTAGHWIKGLFWVGVLLVIVWVFYNYLVSEGIP